MKRVAPLGIALGVAVGLITPAQAAQPREISGDITVLAASSLTEAFTEIGEKFEKKHPDTNVTFSFSSSSILVTQVQQGAPADVIATADEANMQELVDSGDVPPDSFSDATGEHAYDVFARNRLEIAVAPGNPKHITKLEDTLASDVTLVLCAPEAPCGKYALEAYDKADLTVPKVPTGMNAKATLAKVALGEADAAVVYVTDVKSAGDDVEAVKIPDAENVIAEYPIAPLANAVNGPGAKAFVLLVESKVGQRILRKLGFLAP